MTLKIKDAGLSRTDKDAYEKTSEMGAGSRWGRQL